jgi:hypothetical protein
MISPLNMAMSFVTVDRPFSGKAGRFGSSSLVFEINRTCAMKALGTPLVGEQSQLTHYMLGSKKILQKTTQTL